MLCIILSQNVLTIFAVTLLLGSQGLRRCRFEGFDQTRHFLEKGSQTHQYLRKIDRNLNHDTKGHKDYVIFNPQKGFEPVN